MTNRTYRANVNDVVSFGTMAGTIVEAHHAYVLVDFGQSILRYRRNDLGTVTPCDTCARRAAYGVTTPCAQCSTDTWAGAR